MICTRWLTAAGAAAYLALSVKRVQNLSAPSTPAADRLPFSRLAGAKRFCLEQLDRWMQAHGA